MIKGIKTYCLCLVGVLLSGLQLHAQSDAVAQFDSGYVETGNPYILHLSVQGNYGKPINIDFSAWDTLLPAKNILQATGWKEQDNKWVNALTLISFDSIKLELPPLYIAFSGGERVPTNSLELTVLPTPAPNDPVDMEDIKDIHREPIDWQDYVRPALPIAAGILLFGLAIWWVLFRKKKSGLRAERRIQQPPHELAFRKLAELDRKQHWQQGKIKSYYSELTYIAREYLERRYQVPALESTSAEMLEMLRQTKMPAALFAPLAELLRWADLAKFAKGQPPEHFHAQALKEVYQIVEETKELPPETENGEVNINKPSTTNN